jgi:CRISPR-associated endonuclease Cas1
MKLSLPLKAQRKIIIFGYNAKIFIDNDNQIHVESSEKLEVHPVMMVFSILINDKSEISISDMSKLSPMGVDIVFDASNGVSLLSGVNKKKCKNKSLQISRAISVDLRFGVAKELLVRRLRFSKEHLGYSLPQLDESKAGSVQDALLLEAKWMKHFYEICSSFYGLKWKGRALEFQNKNPMFLFNNLLYSKVRSLIMALNLDPDIGFIHGHTGGNGFVYDISDIYKPVVCIDLASSLMKQDISDWQELREKFFDKCRSLNLNEVIVRDIKRCLG